MFLQKILFGILTVAVFTDCAKKADPAREDIENHLASKTPYRVIANKNDKEIKYPGCKAVRIWSIHRHGTRNPSRKFVDCCRTHLTKIRDRTVASERTNLDEQQILALRNWKVIVPDGEEKFLVYEGEDELIELAERMQKRFPHLLVENYDPIFYKFKYTATQRALKSAESFVTGLFGRQNIKQVSFPEALHKDPVLRFYKLCTSWRAEVDKNPDSLAEAKKFNEGPEMQAALKLIMKKAGVTGLSAVDAHLIYTACAFETAWSKHHMSPWCSLFDRQSIRTLEYLKELEHYYVDGYGYELTTKLACPAIIDMMEHISPLSVQPNATFYFTHSGTILKLLAHLHLYQDDFTLTHADLNRNRKWRISKIDAFASNLAFVAFDCETETKVLTLHQERVVHLPGCPENEDLCSLDKLRHILKDSLEHCHFYEMCKIT